MANISTEIAEIQGASRGSEVRQPIVDALNKVNANTLPSVSASDAGKFLTVNNSGSWEVKSGGLAPTPTGTKNITENGTHDVTNYASASVNVQPDLGTKSITENGTYNASSDDLDGYSSVTVNVQGGGGVIQPLSVTQNGTYTPPSGVDGYAPVNVSVSGGGSISEVTLEPTINDMQNGEVQILISAEQVLDDKPTCEEVTAGIAGQNQSSAINALNYSGILNNSYKWTTADRNYNDLWVGADFGDPIVLNAFVVAPRTFSNNRQIYTIIFEASNDLSNWYTIGTAPSVGNEIPENKWYACFFNQTTQYRYYRIRTETDAITGRINGSATFTLQGLGFLNSNNVVPPYKAFYKRNNILYRFFKKN